MPLVTIRDGNNNPQTAAVSSASAAGNPQVAVVEALPSGTNTIGSVNSNGLIITTVTASTVSVTTTSGTALSANANRKGATFVNTGASDITLRRGATAIAGSGVVLKANGGSYEINASNLYTGIVTAITASSSSSLAIEEGV